MLTEPGQRWPPAARARTDRLFAGWPRGAGVILARVRRTLRERGLIEPGARVLAACSGGPDSAAMLVALARLGPELGFTLEAASVDHGLRVEARAELEIAREQAAAAGVRFHALAITVPASRSLQAAARAARYAALLELCTRIGAKRLAVGHTQDDQAETVLMRVLRGASVSGLGGILPARADGVIRPLIDCRRGEVARFAVEHVARIADDPSNRDARFERVRVRDAILPLLAREDAAVVPHLADLADDARALLEALGAYAERLLTASAQDSGKIDVSAWSSEPVAIRRLALRRFLERTVAAEVGRAHLLEAERALFAPAEVWLPGGFVLKSRGDGCVSISRGPS